MYLYIIKMVSVTISVPKEIRELMKRFPEVNWSGLVRKSISEKARELQMKEEMLNQFEKEKSFNNWAVNLIRDARKTNINNDTFDHYLNELKDSIQLIKRIDYSDFLVDAMLLSPDEKDADFFDLCLKNSCPIWSNDLTLKKQEKIKVLTTKEIILLL